MFKKKTLMSALALTAIVSFNHAAALSPNQVQQTKVQIKSYQQQKNYSAAEQLINSLIKSSPDQAINYVYLAYNQYYAKQPQLAKQTLDNMIATKDMSKTSDSTKQAVSKLYKAIANQPALASSAAPANKTSAPKKRVKKVSQPKQPSDLSFGATLETGYDSNHNLYPNRNTPAEIKILEDAQLLALKPEKRSALYSLLALEMNAQSKSIALGSQNLVLKHDVEAEIEGRLVPDVEILIEPALNYTFTPDVQTGGRFFTAHSYPINLSFAGSAAGSNLGFKFSPTLELMSDHSLGYEFAMASTPSPVEEEANTLTASDSFFYEYDKAFNGSAFANLNVQARFTAESEAFNKYELAVKAAIKPVQNLSIEPSYAYDLTQFVYEEGDDQQSDVAHNLRALVSYQLGANFELGLKLDQRIQTSTFLVASYSRTLIALQLGWAN